MTPLTDRQQQVLNFIQTHQQQKGVIPTLREIATHFAFRSMTAAVDHVRVLQRKGYLDHEPRRARSLRVLAGIRSLGRPFARIPLYGSIPAGYADERQQESEGEVLVDLRALGIRPQGRIFALQVRGDSMVGRHILDGDQVILDAGRKPRHGDAVAALIENQSTLKTFVIEKGRPFLRAENVLYPKIIPASELVIQGVMVGLVRKHI
jgi:repressor LexA